MPEYLDFFVAALTLAYQYWSLTLLHPKDKLPWPRQSTIVMQARHDSEREKWIFSLSGRRGRLYTSSAGQQGQQGQQGRRNQAARDVGSAEDNE